MRNLQVGIPAPNPSYPQPIQVVTGEQEVVVRGKNKIDTQYYESGSIDATTGEDTPNARNGRGSNYIPVLPNTQYTISVKQNVTNLRLSEYTSSKINIQRDVANNNSTLTITTTANTYFVRWSLNYDNSTEVTQTIIDNLDLMLCEGTDTTYEPYITPITKQLSLGDIELAKISDYQDYIYKSSGKWYKHSEVGKETFTGGDSENWTVSQSGTDNWFYSLQKAIGGDTAKTNQLKSNYYPYSSITSTTTGEGIWYSTSYIRVRYGTEDTSSNYKTWLSTHNVLLYYILATATDTEITNTTLINQLEDIYNMQSVNGTTIIEINGNLPMIMKVRALKND